MAARTIQVIAILVSVLVTWNAAEAADPIDDLLSATFRIADRDHSGTCFLISEKVTDPAKPRRVILATAAHVMREMSGSRCEVILRSESGDRSYSRTPFSITIRDGDIPNWTRHPAVDVATMLIDLPDGVAVKPLSFDQLADESRLIDRTIRAGSEAWIPCYPAKLEANEAGWPILRRGSIASHPLTPVNSNKTILIDIRAFGGESGAPVAMIVNDRPMVFAVVSGMHRQTDRSTIPFEERTMHTPLGVSIVVQTTFLRETIDLMYAK